MSQDHLIQHISQRLEGDLAKLKGLGITEHAIITYIRRLQEGRSREAAANGLLRGRLLTPDQIQYVRSVLDRLSGTRAAGG